MDGGSRRSSRVSVAWAPEAVKNDNSGGGNENDRVRALRRGHPYGHAHSREMIHIFVLPTGS